MGSSNYDMVNVDIERRGPKLSPEDEFTSSYLEERSEVYRQLVKVSLDVWNNPQASETFRWERDNADNSAKTDGSMHYNLMRNIGGQIDKASGGALRLPVSNARVLDLCMAPGGFTASVLSYSPHADVCAFTLPLKLGGRAIVHPKDDRVHVRYGDITMLHTEFGVIDPPHDHCEYENFSDERLWLGKRFDLVLCDGNQLRVHEPHIAENRKQKEAIRLDVSQLILAMQRIESGGTFIMLLHKLAAYGTLQILHVFDHISEIQIFKSTGAHRKKGTFYLIAKNVQPEHPQAVAAIHEWKRVWKQLTFPTPSPDGQEAPALHFSSESEMKEKVTGLLERFGERAIELGEPIWEIQKEALETANWNKKTKNDWSKTPKTDWRDWSKSPKSDWRDRSKKPKSATANWRERPDRVAVPEQVEGGRAPAAVTDNATTAVHDLDDGLGDGAHLDDVDGHPGGPADSAKVQSAMQGSRIGD